MASEDKDKPPPDAPLPVRRQSSKAEQAVEAVQARAEIVAQAWEDGGIAEAAPMVVRVASGTAIECAGGCGFWAVKSVNRDMCSKCYKQSCVLSPEPPKEPEAQPVIKRVASATKAIFSPPPPAEEPKKVQENTSRCWICNKKIGLTGFKCKCEYYFCPTHRYSDRHDCPFDYKNQAKEQLAQANPKIEFSKVDKL